MLSHLISISQFVFLNLSNTINFFFLSYLILSNFILSLLLISQSVAFCTTPLLSYLDLIQLILSYQFSTFLVLCYPVISHFFKFSQKFSYLFSTFLLVLFGFILFHVNFSKILVSYLICLILTSFLFSCITFPILC